MLPRLLEEAPHELFFVSLVPLSVSDLVKLSLTCRSFLRLLYADEQDASIVLLNAVARGVCLASPRSSQPLRVTLQQPLGEAPLHKLGLSLRICSKFCAAMQHVRMSQAISLESPEELFALTTAHMQLSELVKGLGHKVMRLGPLVGALLPIGDAQWFVIDFAFPTGNHDELQACSDWHWLDVPPKAGVRFAGGSLQAQTACRVGVQLQADTSSGKCERPELRCAVAAPVQAWVVLHAVSAVVGTTFEVGLAAADFDAYGREDDGWYFPREECSWRDSPDEDVESCSSDASSDEQEHASIDEQDTEDSASTQSPSSVRVVLRVCSAMRTKR